MNCRYISAILREIALEIQFPWEKGIFIDDIEAGFVNLKGLLQRITTF